MSNLEERLYEALAAQAEAASPQPDAWQENARRVQRDRMVRWRTPVAVAAALAILCGAAFGIAEVLDRPDTVHATSTGDGSSPSSGTDVGGRDCTTSGTGVSAIFDGSATSWRVSFFPDIDAGRSAPLCYALTVERTGQPADVIQGGLPADPHSGAPGVAFDYLDVVEAGGTSWVIGGLDNKAAPRLGVVYSDGFRGDETVMGAGRTWAFLLHGGSSADPQGAAPVRLIAYDSGGGVLQDVDLEKRFGPNWWSR